MTVVQGSAQAAGHKPEAVLAEEVVTSACADKVAQAPPVGEGTYIDFGHLKQQLSLERLLGHLGLRRGCRAAGRCGAVPARFTAAMVGAGRSA